MSSRRPKFTPRSRQELKAAIDTRNPEHGPMNSWDVTHITNMSFLFVRMENFNENISNWNVANVTNMTRMFYGASSFNQDIGGWETDNVTDMSYMFSGASSFNQHLNGWETSNVTDMSNMFSGATSYNKSMSRWDVAKVTDMSRMFYNASSFNQDLEIWYVAEVIHTDEMFTGATSFTHFPYAWLRDGHTAESLGFEGDIDEEGLLIPNNIQRPGVAFEIHNVFHKIDMNQYINVLTTFNQAQPAHIEISSIDDIAALLKPHFDNYVDTDTLMSPETIDMHKIQFALVVNALKGGEWDEQSMNVLIETVKYILSTDFSDANREYYIFVLINSSATAYDINPNNSSPGPDATMSCAHGIFERFITVVVDTIQQIRVESRTETQKTIFGILSESMILPKPNTLISLWKEYIVLNEPDIATIVNAVSKLSEEIPIPPESARQIIESFTEFVKTEYRKIEPNIRVINAQIQNSNDEIMYMPQQIKDGGGRRIKSMHKKSMKTKPKLTKRRKNPSKRKRKTIRRRRRQTKSRKHSR